MKEKEEDETEREREGEGEEQKVVSDTGNLVVIVTNYDRGYGRPIYRLCHASKTGKEAPGGACQPHAASLTII